MVKVITNFAVVYKLKTYKTDNENANTNSGFASLIARIKPIKYGCLFCLKQRIIKIAMEIITWLIGAFIVFKLQFDKYTEATNYPSKFYLIAINVLINIKTVKNNYCNTFEYSKPNQQLIMYSEFE